MDLSRGLGDVYKRQVLIYCYYSGTEFPPSKITL
jgi:hypothetical protein